MTCCCCSGFLGVVLSSLVLREVVRRRLWSVERGDQPRQQSTEGQVWTAESDKRQDVLSQSSHFCLESSVLSVRSSKFNVQILVFIERSVQCSVFQVKSYSSVFSVWSWVWSLEWKHLNVYEVWSVVNQWEHPALVSCSPSLVNKFWCFTLNSLITQLFPGNELSQWKQIYKAPLVVLMIFIMIVFIMKTFILFLNLELKTVSFAYKYIPQFKLNYRNALICKSAEFPL